MLDIKNYFGCIKTKHEIEIPDLPEGLEATAYRKPKNENEHTISDDLIPIPRVDLDFPCLIIRKKQHRRIVLEETEEETNSSRNHTIYVKDITIDIYSDKKWKIMEDGK